MILALTLILLGPTPCISSSALDEVRIELKSQARVPGSWVELGHVANITGVSESRRAELAAMKLVHAPMPGVTRVLSVEDITKRLKALGVREPVAFEDTVHAVRITTAVKILPGSELVAFGHKFLEAKLKEPGVHIRIEDPAAPRALILPGGEEMETELRAEMTARKLAGLVPVSVEVWSEGKRRARMLLSYRVHARAAVAEAAHTLGPGMIITEADLGESERDLSLVPQDVLQSREALLGLRVTRRINAGAMVRKSAVALPIMVKRGEPVTLVARVGTVEARALAQAKANGVKGEVVTVVNVVSKRHVRARVVGRELVEAVIP